MESLECREPSLKVLASLSPFLLTKALPRVNELDINQSPSSWQIANIFYYFIELGQRSLEVRIPIRRKLRMITNH